MAQTSMNSDSPDRRSSAPLWTIIALLSMIAICLIIELGTSTAAATLNTANVCPSGGSVLAVAGQVTRDNYGLYIVDTDEKTICVYEWAPSAKVLRLVAARTYKHDRRLNAYNTEPSPAEIEKLVNPARGLDEAPTRP